MIENRLTFSGVVIIVMNNPHRLAKPLWKQLDSESDLEDYSLDLWLLIFSKLISRSKMGMVDFQTMKSSHVKLVSTEKSCDSVGCHNGGGHVVALDPMTGEPLNPHSLRPTFRQTNTPLFSFCNRY